VQIFDDDDSTRRPVAEQVQKGIQDPGSVPSVQILPQSVDVRGHVHERRECAGWDDRVAGAPERRGGCLAVEGVDQRGLADSRLADD
jgi:hypothetical protein